MNVLKVLVYELIAYDTCVVKIHYAEALRYVMKKEIISMMKAMVRRCDGGV